MENLKIAFGAGLRSLASLLPSRCQPAASSTVDAGFRRHGGRCSVSGRLLCLALPFVVGFAAALLTSNLASASSFASIYQFQGGNDGSGPGPLTLGPGGKLYGLTFGGGGGPCNGIYGCGAAFKLTPPKRPGAAWTETVIYAFQGGNEGSSPSGNLIWGEDGALYGATAWGGGSGCST